MFTITLTRQQLYEFYYEGPEATIHLIEGLMEELADFERLLGRRQQRVIDAQRERNERQAAQLKRVKEELWRQQSLNSQLTRRLQELQAELERHEVGQVRRDSHNSSLPPALDPPAVKAQNAVRRTRSLRRKTGRRVGGQPGHRGSTLPRVERPDRVITYRPQHCRRCAAPPGRRRGHGRGTAAVLRTAARAGRGHRAPGRDAALLGLRRAHEGRVPARGAGAGAVRGVSEGESHLPAPVPTAALGPHE